MKKLLAGIAEFRRNVRPSYREKFAQLALGQSPDCLLVACSDSRVVPNLFASTEPGDMFVVRNVGNIVPPCDDAGLAIADRSEGAAVEFALRVLNVSDVVVCGHSECGAMRAILAGELPAGSPNLSEWLDVGRSAVPRLEDSPIVGPPLAPHNRLSQVSVLQQLENLRTYPIVRERLAAGTLGLHAWWFDVAGAEVLAYDTATCRFVPLGEEPDPARV
jgi:carbonic anhydrase